MPEGSTNLFVAGRCIGTDRAAGYDADAMPDMFLTDADNGLLRVDAADILAGRLPALTPDTIILLESHHANPSGEMLAAIHRITASGFDNRIIIARRYDDTDAGTATLHASIDCGAVLMAGFGDGILIEGNALTPHSAARVAFAILQSARLRFTHTEFISCPGCGRTMFDLQSTVAAVKAAVSHLKGLKIGVMGCIVNGPGEMADADYGYVGAGVGRISLYRGKECVEKNIPAAEAVDHLVQLIKADGRWE